MVALVLVLAACGGDDAAGDADPTTTAGASQSSETTATTEPPTATESTAAADSEPETPGTPGAGTVDDPEGDLLDGVDPSTDCGAAPTGSIDLSLVDMAATATGFKVDLTAYEPGEILQVKLVLTAPNGDYYDARARKDGNHTFDGGGPYAWDAGAEITLDGGDDSYSVTVTNVFPEAGWLLELTTRSPCGEDAAELTLG